MPKLKVGYEPHDAIPSLSLAASPLVLFETIISHSLQWRPRLRWQHPTLPTHRLLLSRVRHRRGIRRQKDRATLRIRKKSRSHSKRRRRHRRSSSDSLSSSDSDSITPEAIALLKVSLKSLAVQSGIRRMVERKRRGSEVRNITMKGVSIRLKSWGPCHDDRAVDWELMYRNSQKRVVALCRFPSFYCGRRMMVLGGVLSLAKRFC
ncbi:uncharacterized protein LOC111779964 [Cucurbita pepo subsp. pepo]|uniref:uncharacterized protein LOC111779964 n=1 Tax=Cucurbita pepo subsp. pepo TaxID=3664 RepID=UPI000C9D9C49|nr:uncharacterized protein LOC111779964 [Cucurbita pepo subsp. pepo]